MVTTGRALVLVAALLGASALRLAAPPTPMAVVPRLTALVIVVDGLRPDLITAERTPHLAALGRRGVVSRAHHSVFPTVTRVNASALVTGTGPARHGILDNSIYLPAVDADRALNTGDGARMEQADSVLGGALLDVPTLPALLAAHGRRMAVASSGSSGSAFLLAGAGRAPMINGTMIRPQALAAAVEARLGPAPEFEGAPNLRANARAVDALLTVVIDSLDPDVAMLWLSDPDHTAHGAGLGSLLADSAIRAVDREVGRVLDGLAARGVADRTTVLVVSDHGFSTQAGRAAPIREVLAPVRDQVVEAGSAIHRRPGATVTPDSLVRLLQRAAPVGAIFTASARPGSVQGRIPGTLSFESVGWGHARAGDVLFSADWSHERNAAGIAGWTALAGTAGHGTSSPYDITATFLAAGPAFRQGDTTTVPSANSDIAPTVLSLLGLPIPSSMTGRVLDELWRSRPRGPAIVRQQHHASTTLPGGARYAVTLFTSRIGRTTYVDSTRTTRSMAVTRR